MTESNKHRIACGMGVTCFAISFERDTRPATVMLPVVFWAQDVPTVGGEEEMMMALDVVTIQYMSWLVSRL